MRPSMPAGALRILPAYLGFNGLPDGWAGLNDALRNVQLFARDELTQTEVDTVADLISTATSALNRLPREQR